MSRRIKRKPSPLTLACKAGFLISLLYLFVAGITGISGGVKMLGADYVHQFFGATSNPLVGLMSGLLATALFQSSSATTSLIVGMVAGGALNVGQAIPMVFGANIGTTVTSTIAALGEAGKRANFRRAFQAATVHDMFNLLTVALLLPLELATGLLQSGAEGITGLFVNSGVEVGASGSSVFKQAFKFPLGLIKDLASAFTNRSEVQAIVVLSFSGIAMVGGLAGIARILKAEFAAHLKSLFQRPIQRNPWVGLVTGGAVTATIQSSSVTTSALIPLFTAGVLSIEQVLAIAAGANIGTTTTAVVAALTATGSDMGSGLQVALVHLLFNSAGAAIWIPAKRLRYLPIKASAMLAGFAAKRRTIAAAWVIFTFIVLPITIIGLDRWLH